MPRLGRAWPAIAVTLAVVLAACSGGEASLPEGDSPLAERGRTLVEVASCTNCHSTDGSGGAGPTWRGLAGSPVELEDGSTVVADDDYLRESITDPGAKIVAGYADVMPTVNLDDEDLDAIVAYLRQLGGD